MGTEGTFRRLWDIIYWNRSKFTSVGDAKCITDLCLPSHLLNQYSLHDHCGPGPMLRAHCSEMSEMRSCFQRT